MKFDYSDTTVSFFLFFFGEESMSKVDHENAIRLFYSTSHQQKLETIAPLLLFHDKHIRVANLSQKSSQSMLHIHQDSKFY